MAASFLTVVELFKTKAATDQQVNALVDAILAGQMDERASLGDECRVDVSAAVKTSPFETSVLRNKTRMAGAQRNAARTAILLARAQKAWLDPVDGRRGRLGARQETATGRAGLPEGYRARRKGAAQER